MQTDPNPNSKSAAVLGIISTVVDEIKINRPGWQTTEFYLVALIVVVLQIFAALGDVPKSSAELVSGLTALGYAWMRSNRKDDREGSLLQLIDTFSAALPQLTEAATPNSSHHDTPEPKAADVPAPLPATPSPIATAAPSGTLSGTAGFAQLRVLVCLAVAFLSLVGCAELAKLQADPRVQFAEQEALKIGVAALQRYSNGGSFDSVWGISEGLYAFTDTVSSITAGKSNADANNALAVSLAQTVQSYASTKDTKALAGQIAAIITKADPQTDSQRVAVVNAIAGQLQTAATVAAPAGSGGKAIVPTQARAWTVSHYRITLNRPVRFRTPSPELRTLYTERNEPVYPRVVTQQD